MGLLAALAVPAAARADTGILALGDFGVGGERERATGAALRAFEERNPARVLVTLGDNDYTRSPDAFTANWTASFGWLPAAGVTVAGALGNHDVEVDGGRYELAPLGMPGPYYSRRLGDVELFVLDSNGVSAAQTRWLRRALGRSTARWRIAVFHHPPYTCGGHSGNDVVRRLWNPLFERYRVRLVLSGHDHNYQRFAAVRGVRYVVSGGGGARLYPLARCPAGYPRRLAARASYGFLYVVAGDKKLVLRAVALDGTTLDRVTIRRAGGV